MPFHFLKRLTCLLAISVQISLVSTDHAWAALPPIRIAMIEGMSGPFSNAGQAVQRNVQMAIDNINARGGVTLPEGKHHLALTIIDNKQGVEESLNALRQVTDQHIPFVIQGNSSAVALAMIDAINKHNQRAPDNRILFLNYSAVDPALTNDKCSFRHLHQT